MSHPGDPTSGDDDDGVGYSRPPTDGRFRPGQSGNPRGRPRGSRNFKAVLRETLNSPVRVTRDGKPRKISTQEAMLLRLREKALAGDARALDRLIQLAQTHNNEEVASVAGLSANDQQILRIYNARVLRGAVATPSPSTGDETSIDGGHANDPGSSDSIEGPQSKAPPRRACPL